MDQLPAPVQTAQRSSKACGSELIFELQRLQQEIVGNQIGRRFSLDTLDLCKLQPGSMAATTLSNAILQVEYVRHSAFETVGQSACRRRIDNCPRMRSRLPAT